MPFDRPLSAGCEMTGTIKNGVFYVDDKRTLALNIAKLPNGPAILRIEPAAGQRSLADNRRYWAVLQQTAAASGGQDPDSLHEYYKKKFNNGRSTTLLDEKRFRLYVDMVMGDAAAEFGVEFPVPESLCA